jgi:hypothetical protein
MLAARITSGPHQKYQTNYIEVKDERYEIGLLWSTSR